MLQINQVLMSTNKDGNDLRHDVKHRENDITLRIKSCFLCGVKNDYWTWLMDYPLWAPSRSDSYPDRSHDKIFNRTILCSLQVIRINHAGFELSTTNSTTDKDLLLITHGPSLMQLPWSTVIKQQITCFLEQVWYTVHQVPANCCKHMHAKEDAF